MQARASLNYDRIFIVQATVVTIINYDCKTLIVQATGLLFSGNPGHYVN
jgi:hypothetical protein